MPFDVLVRNGRVLDGTGTPWRVLDLGVRRGRIAQVGRLNRSKASVVIDAAGKYVAPGFIDIHTHSDIGILAEPTCECAVRQGVTTHVIGNCGDSPAPISDVYRELAVRRFTYYAKEGEWAWSTYAEYLAFVERQGVVAPGDHLGRDLTGNDPAEDAIGHRRLRSLLLVQKSFVESSRRVTGPSLIRPTSIRFV